MNRSSNPSPLAPVPKVGLLASASVVSFFASFLPGCRAIAGIFKAGVWVGVVIVVAIVAVLSGVVALARK